VERLVHFARRRHREEVDHVLLELHRHGGQVLRRADVPTIMKILSWLTSFCAASTAFLGS
jgi:hypothetical protein